jgi:hypothetical protein
MGKSERKKYDKYKDKKYYSSKKQRQSTSDSSSESNEHAKSHHNRSRAHKHQCHLSRSPIEKKPDTQSTDLYEQIHVSKEERVTGERSRKRQSAYDDMYKDESQKKSCHSRDEADQLEFSFQRYSYELKVYLRDEDLLPEPEDFLKFLKNYEAVQKRAGGRIHNLAAAGKKERQKSKSYFSERPIKFVKYFSCILPGTIAIKKYEGHAVF